MLIFYFLVLLTIYSQKYTVVSVEQTSLGVGGYLTLNTSYKGSITPPAIIKTLHFDFLFETPHRLRLRITDNSSKRWEVPAKDFLASKTPSERPKLIDYNIKIYRPTFGFRVLRVSDNTVLFDTLDYEFYYSNEYLEISTALNSDDIENGPHVYGIGERVEHFRLDSVSGYEYVLFNKDYYGLKKNSYGSHPFMMQYYKKKAHGLFMFNSNAQSFELNRNRMKYRTIGGIIDMFIFTGTSPKQVVKQYLQVIGNPYLPPLWATAYHHCRWGLRTLEATKEIVSNFKKYDIPIDTMWNDLDTMYKLRDWTVDEERYPLKEYAAFVDNLNKNNMHYVQIIDNGIPHKVLGTYYPYEEGRKRDVFIKSHNNFTYEVKSSTAGRCVWVDWTPKGRKYWSDIYKWYMDSTGIKLSGIWCDMNEISAYDPAEEEFSETFISDYKFNPNHPWYFFGDKAIYEKTIKMDAIRHYPNSIEYNTHNLNGYYEARASVEALLDYYQHKKRPFVLSRSTFAGSGDNHPTYEDLYYSISGIMSMSIFGMSHAGVDICGFAGSTTEELCTRWYQVGAFYPFSRNHNSMNCHDQNPWSFGDILLNSTRNVIKMRYSLLSYFYTQFYLAHSEGDVLFRPFIMEYDQDDSGYIPFIDAQFLVGDALVVSPVVTENERTVEIYYPKDIWYDFYNYEILSEKCKPGSKCVLQAPLEMINVHIRGGYVLPMKKPELTSYETMKNPYKLIIALDSNATSNGVLFCDDGITPDTVENNMYSLFYFDFERVDSSQYMLKKRDDKLFYKSIEDVSELVVIGVERINKIMVNGKEHTDFNYDESVMVLYVENLRISMIGDLNVFFYR